MALPGERLQACPSDVSKQQLSKKKKSYSLHKAQFCVWNLLSQDAVEVEGMKGLGEKWDIDTFLVVQLLVVC